jgi:hypothetical protein
MSVGIHDYVAETSIITISPLLGAADAPEMLATLTYISRPLILNMALDRREIQADFEISWHF